MYMPSSSIKSRFIKVQEDMLIKLCGVSVSVSVIVIVIVSVSVTILSVANLKFSLPRCHPK